MENSKYVLRSSSSRLRKAPLGPSGSRIKELGEFSPNAVYKRLCRQRKTSATERLPTYGSTPCTAYCKNCKTIVHTNVIVYSNQVPSSILGVFSPLLACCDLGWVKSIHTCPICRLVLGRSR